MEFTSLPEEVKHIRLAGRLDIAGAQQIDRPFSYATTVRRERIVVDLSDVTFVASIGIRLLLTAARAQATRGGQLVLAAPQPMVRRVLETAGIDQLVPLIADVASARAAFGDAPPQDAPSAFVDDDVARG